MSNSPRRAAVDAHQPGARRVDSQGQNKINRCACEPSSREPESESQDFYKLYRIRVAIPTVVIIVAMARSATVIQLDSCFSLLFASRGAVAPRSACTLPRGPATVMRSRWRPPHARVCGGPCRSPALAARTYTEEEERNDTEQPRNDHGCRTRIQTHRRSPVQERWGFRH